jgi:hypothetical protein
MGTRFSISFFKSLKLVFFNNHLTLDMYFFKFIFLYTRVTIDIGILNPIPSSGIKIFNKKNMIDSHDVQFSVSENQETRISTLV